MYQSIEDKQIRTGRKITGSEVVKIGGCANTNKKMRIAVELSNVEELMIKQAQAGIDRATEQRNERNKKKRSNNINKF